jgi:hypothetical protein
LQRGHQQYSIFWSQLTEWIVKSMLSDGQGLVFMNM